MKITDDYNNKWSIEAMLYDGEVYFTKEELLKLSEYWSDWKLNASNDDNYIMPAEGSNDTLILHTWEPKMYILTPTEMLADKVLYRFPVKWSWYEV